MTARYQVHIDARLSGETGGTVSYYNTKREADRLAAQWKKIAQRKDLDSSLISVVKTS